MILGEAGVRDLVMECLGDVLAEVNAAAEDRDRAASPIPISLLARAGASGLLALAAPEKVGGQGGDVRSWGRVVQQIGRQCQDIAFPGLLNISLSVITRLAGTGRADLIEDAAAIMRGESFCGVAYSEDSDPFSIRTTLVRDGGGYRMTGHKMFVAGGLQAGLFLVYALDECRRHGRMPGAARRSGLEVAHVLTTGLRTLGGAVLILDAVPLDRDRILAGSDGLLDAQQGLTLRRLLHCGPPLGRAQDIFDITVTRLAATERYGQRLADMPNVQAIIGQMYIALEAAQAL